jgi:glutathione S-transferase
MLTLYYKKNCPYSQKVLQFLQSHPVPMKLKEISTDEKAKYELQRLGGKVQVPCLFIDDTPLYESDAILHWLENRI